MSSCATSGSPRRWRVAAMIMKEVMETRWTIPMVMTLFHTHQPHPAPPDIHNFTARTRCAAPPSTWRLRSCSAPGTVWRLTGGPWECWCSRCSRGTRRSKCNPSWISSQGAMMHVMTICHLRHGQMLIPPKTTPSRRTHPFCTTTLFFLNTFRLNRFRSLHSCFGKTQRNEREEDKG